MDPGYQMLRQATLGDVDFITGDYLAEMNMAENAEAFAQGKHDGWEPTAWDGLQQSLDVINEKRIKVIINGGSINPKGLAHKTEALVREKGLKLVVAYVEGDDLLPEMKEMLLTSGSLPPHLEPEDSGVKLAENARAYVDQQNKPIVAANAYLGARAIVTGLENGADIIICGRVADASPVIGAAWYWHSWTETSYDALAGALVAGHLIECSAYVTGSNFSGFTDYALDDLVDLAFGIAEINADGTCVISKHDKTNGMVNEDTVTCQFLYELQGDTYLHSDVKALLSDVQIKQVGKDRVHVSGIKGAPPPPTTKLAIFYRAGYQSELLICATGYGTAHKFALQEKQIRHGLACLDLTEAFDTLLFQAVGVPLPNAPKQLQSTTYLRIFAQASAPAPLLGLLQTFAGYGMQHFSGMHGALTQPVALPRPYLGFYPAVYPQCALEERVTILNSLDDTSGPLTLLAGHPPHHADHTPRASYDTPSPTALASFGTTRRLRLGDVTHARSGDKGANVNIGFFPRLTNLSPSTASDLTEFWAWFRTYLSLARLQELLGDDWHEGRHKLERCEFEGLKAVHFVVYGLLGRGVSSATNLDVLGKGVADWIRARVVEVPERFLREDWDGEGDGLSLDGGGRG